MKADVREVCVKFQLVNKKEVRAVDSCYSLGCHKSQVKLDLPGRENGIRIEEITGAKVKANLRRKY